MLKNKLAFRLMVKFSLVLALAAVALCFGVNRLSVSAKGPSPMPPVATAVTEYNAREEFTLTQGGTTGVWNYGYSTSNVDNTFNLFTQGVPANACGFTIEGWSSPAAGGSTPLVGRNPAATSFSCAGLTYPPELLVLHPGYHLDLGRRAVLRWTAPVAGTFLVNGVMQRIDSATTDIKILKNTTEPALFSGDINGASSQQAFNFTVTVIVGDTLDFSIGSGPDGYYGDSTGLALTISQPLTACQTSPANLRVSLPAENSPSDTQSGNSNASLVGDASYVNSGKVGRAFSFDGAGDYVRIEDSPAQKPLNQLTVEGWFKINSLTGYPHLVSKPLKNSPFNSYGLWFDGGNVHVAYYDTGATFFNYSTGFVPQLGVWNHYAMVLNTEDVGPTANTIKLLVNGVEVFSGAVDLPIFYNGINDAFPAHPLLIGADLENNEPSFFLNGQADEVSIYDRALTQVELFNLTRQGGFGKCPPSNCAQSPKGLVSLFQGEANALDSRSNNHGTNNGATFTTGKVGQALNLNGTGQHLTFGNTLGNVGAGDFAVEFWIQTSTNRLEEILSKRVCGIGNAIPFFDVRKFDDGRILAEIGDGSAAAIALFSTRTVTDGIFHHIAVERSSNTFALYIDGTLEISAAGAAGVNINNGAPFVVGALGCIGVDTTQSFTGTIDEVSFYSNALTASEISTINAAGQSGKCRPIGLNPITNQIVWLTGDGDARDISGNNNNGAFVGSSSFAVGKVGQGFNFTGGQTVQAADNATLDLTNAFTIETWVSPTAAGLDTQQTFFVSKGNMNFANTQSYGIVFEADRRIANRVANGSTLDQLVSTGQIPLNTFTHIATTYDGSTLRIYINGVLDSSQATSIGTLLNSSQPLILGGGDFGGSTINAQSAIDEVSLYNRSLTASEIAAIYNAGVAGKLKSIATPASAQAVTAQLSDATVTFAQVTTAGMTTEAGLDLGLLPVLPPSVTFTGLAYDVSTTAIFSGNANVCFNLPSINSQPTFAQLRLLHLESGAWIDRTSLQNFPSRTLCGQVSSFSPFVIARNPISAPTAAPAVISGSVFTPDGVALGGVTIRLNGPVSAITITDAFGIYHFDNVDTGQFYTVAPARVNYHFNPSNRSFSLVANRLDAVFTAIPETVPVGNAIDTSEYFVRQQYLDFLGREPDHDGWLFWTDQINRCGQDEYCVRQKQLDVSAAFFMSEEFQQSGNYIYRLYRAALSRQLTYAEFTADHSLVVGGLDLASRRTQFADTFVQRAEFEQKYQNMATADAFVTALLQGVLDDSRVDLSGQRAALIAAYNSADNNGGYNLEHSRSAVLQVLAESTEFKSAVYNSSFVLMEYFGYLRRDIDRGGFDFWIDVLNNRAAGNYRGMVCSFLTSTEYQQRFGSVVSRSNAECGQ